MKYHTLFFRKLEKMSQNLSSAAVVIGAYRVNRFIVLRNYHVSKGLGILMAYLPSNVQSESLTGSIIV